MAEVVVFPVREAPGVSWVNSINPSFCASRAGRRKENAKQFTRFNQDELQEFLHFLIVRSLASRVPTNAFAFA